MKGPEGLVIQRKQHPKLCCRGLQEKLLTVEEELKTLYILIRYPAQTNMKHLSCNKPPQLGCVNTSRVRSSLLRLHQQNGWK